MFYANKPDKIILHQVGLWPPKVGAITCPVKHSLDALTMHED